MKKIHTLTGIAAFMAVAAQGAIVLPDEGNSVTFEAEGWNFQSGTSTFADATNASGGEYIDALAASNSSLFKDGDWMEFAIDPDSINPLLSYTIDVTYRKGGGNAVTSVLDVYFTTDGTEAKETTIDVAHTGDWTGAFEGSAAGASDFSLVAGTTTNTLVIESHSLPGGTGFAHIDYFTITAVPEPSSAALLGLGGIALILRRRK